MNLVDVNVNEYAVITKMNIEDFKFKTRLQELGLYEGAEIMLLKFSPLKETCLVKIFNSVLAIKSEVLNQIEVRLI